MRQILAIVLFLVIPGFTQESAHKHGGSSQPRETGATANRFGTVQFKTSCDLAVASDFDGAVALLHSFEYDEARAAFVAVQSKDPKCAMASWGESMAELHKQFPDDREATIFYALALNISAKRSDKTHADLKQCTALLYPLFAEMPNHPGVAHYIIHCNDNPEMAKYGLEAARKYAQIAPDSTHATHMPSHIFAQMGLWNEMVESNQVSLRAAEENPNAMSCEKVGNALHAMSFLVVALPQSGRMQEAQGVLEHSQSIKPAAATGDRCNDDGKSEVLAAYVIETGDWKRAKELKIKEGYSSPLMGTLWMAVGIGAVQAGDMAQADTAERQLAAMRDARSKLPGQSVDNGLEALRLALAGWRAEQAGEKVVAEQDLRKAADLQDRLDSNYVIIKPVREMLADLLLLNGNPAGALAEYRAVLILQPNRFNSVYGAGTAALRSGDKVTAKVYYTQLLGLAGGDDVPNL
jgi:tetratricopeptide (TPR) repeat protein